MTDAERLREFENACEALWPYVRHFGLCGADPQAVDATLRIGNLLGHGQLPADVAIVESSRRARSEALDWAAEWLAGHRFVGGKFMRSAVAQAVQELKQVATNADRQPLPEIRSVDRGDAGDG